jgi:hypothetical protein
MLRFLAMFRRRSGGSALGLERAHRRDIGMDDWDGSIGTSQPDRLWPDQPAPARPTRSFLIARGVPL